MNILKIAIDWWVDKRTSHLNVIPEFFCRESQEISDPRQKNSGMTKIHSPLPYLKKRVRSVSFIFITTNSLTPIKFRFLPIIFSILFLSSCSDPFPKGALFDLMILQKLISSGSTSSNKYIFLTVGTYTGALVGGITGADAKCQTEKTNNYPNVPGAASEYKAFIVNNSTRKACSTPDCSTGILENVDWILKPNTDYYRLDGTTDTKIFTTNSSGIVNFTLGSTLLTTIDSSGTTFWWTGMGVDWAFFSACTGDNWGNTTGNGSYGNGGTTGSSAIDIGTVHSCNGFLKKLLCVRQ